MDIMLHIKTKICPKNYILSLRIVALQLIAFQVVGTNVMFAQYITTSGLSAEFGFPQDLSREAGVINKFDIGGGKGSSYELSLRGEISIATKNLFGFGIGDKLNWLGTYGAKISVANFQSDNYFSLTDTYDFDSSYYKVTSFTSGLFTDFGISYNPTNQIIAILQGNIGYRIITNIEESRNYLYNKSKDKVIAEGDSLANSPLSYGLKFGAGYVLPSDNQSALRIDIATRLNLSLISLGFKSLSFSIGLAFVPNLALVPEIKGASKNEPPSKISPIKASLPEANLLNKNTFLQNEVSDTKVVNTNYNLNVADKPTSKQVTSAWIDIYNASSGADSASTSQNKALQVISTKTKYFHLLPFFIDKKYISESQILNEAGRNNFSEAKLARSNEYEIYKNILNLLGYRLQYNSGMGIKLENVILSEPNTSLDTLKSQVTNFLTDNWNIPESRLKTNSKAISSPIELEWVETDYSPPQIGIKKRIYSPTVLKSTLITIEHDGKTVAEYDPDNSVSQIEFKLNPASKFVAGNITKLVATISATDSLNQTVKYSDELPLLIVENPMKNNPECRIFSFFNGNENFDNEKTDSEIRQINKPITDNLIAYFGHCKTTNNKNKDYKIEIVGKMCRELTSTVIKQVTLNNLEIKEISVKPTQSPKHNFSRITIWNN